MKVLRTVKELTEFSRELRAQGKTIGLVPTMGALHDGHLSLVKRARGENDAVVVSVFVNPTQFNNPDDLSTYPRTEQADASLLEGEEVDAMFAPSVQEIYPSGGDEGHTFDLGSVAEVMEGAMRPGHFQGVAQIVSKLLRLTAPHRAYFGEKDFQQIAVIRRMVQTENIDVEIVSCPIVREADGLALSSRNVRLTPEQRKIAPGIHKVLTESASNFSHRSISDTRDWVIKQINALPFCEVEYFSIVDGVTLQPVTAKDEASHIVGCITVYCGDVRLIDNICYRK